MSADDYLIAMEKMIEQSDLARQQERERWNSLTPAQKTAESKQPELEQGIKECPFCGMIPRVYRSLADGYELRPCIYNFEERPADEVLAANRMPRCRNHNEDARPKLMAMRFETYADLREFWNGLIAETVAKDQSEIGLPAGRNGY